MGTPGSGRFPSGLTPQGGKTRQRNRDERALCSRPTFHRASATPERRYALAKLPEDEQKVCRALWAEFDALLAKCGQTTPPRGLLIEGKPTGPVGLAGSERWLEVRAERGGQSARPSLAKGTPVARRERC